MRSFLNELGVPHETRVPLAPLTWYGVGGPAEVLARPSSLAQLSQLAATARQEGIPIHVLGDGANVLIADEGVPGIVVRLDQPAFTGLTISGSRVTAGAGVNLPALVLATAREGLAGLDCLAGIPASVGGAVRMNAGGIYGSIGQSVTRLQVMDAAGQVYYRDRDDLVFGYRSTNIVARFILEAVFELQSEDADELRARVKKVFFAKKNSQPLHRGSAGCAFRNLESLPDSVDPATPLSAGRLIDLAGLKGYAAGHAVVSTRHANFIIAEPGCTASDILGLMEHIEQTVEQRLGVRLKREVEIWPRSSTGRSATGKEAV